MTAQPRLILPEMGYAAGYLAALGEGYTDSSLSAGTPRDIAADLEAHLAGLNRQGGVERAVDGTEYEKPPFAHFWLVAGAAFIGRVSMRYQLNALLLQSGGNIGYAIRPSRRGEGFGHVALRLAKAHAAAHGLTRVLLTCDDTNLASARIIEAGGGVLEDVIAHPQKEGQRLRRYWIRFGDADKLDDPFATFFEWDSTADEHANRRL